ncbi:MAG: hypothetical protein WCY92_13105 [Novosphingobium sp.]
MTPLERAEELLAEAEASLAAGTNPYAVQNLATHRARVARLRTAGPAAPIPAAAAPITPPAAPKLAGTREERLSRLATAMGADKATLAAAIAAGTPPDVFALELTDVMIARRKAAAEAAELEATVRRIAAA